MRTELLAASLLLLTTGAQAATPKTDPDGQWWVVVGSFADKDTTHFQENETAIDRLTATVKRCGLETFEDFSGKFEGFSPGFDVVVVGSYRKKAEAEAAMAQVKPCVPGAYVRHGSYAGD